VPPQAARAITQKERIGVPPSAVGAYRAAARHQRRRRRDRAAPPRYRYRSGQPVTRRDRRWCGSQHGSRVKVCCRRAAQEHRAAARGRRRHQTGREAPPGNTKG